MTTTAPEPGPAEQLTVAPPPLVQQGQAGWLIPARVAGLLTALVLIGLGALSVTAQFVTETRTGPAQTYGPEVKRLEVTSDTGDLHLRIGSGTQTTVRTVRSFSFATPVVTSALTDGTLRLGQSCDRRVWLVLPGDCSVDFEVTLPAGVAVQLTSNTGDIRVQGASGDVRVESDTGDVSLLGTRSANVRVTGSTGDIRLQFDAAPQTVSVRTDVGDVRVRVPADENTYLVKAHSDAGDTTVDEALRNGRSARVIEAETNAGDITVSAG